MDNSLELNQEIGERIRRARQAKNMSQQELSVKADISLPHISEIENGKKSMKLVTFIRIIEALQVSADSIIVSAKEVMVLGKDASPSAMIRLGNRS